MTKQDDKRDPKRAHRGIKSAASVPMPSPPAQAPRSRVPRAGYNEEIFGIGIGRSTSEPVTEKVEEITRRKTTMREWTKVLATIASLAVLYLAFVNPTLDRIEGRFDRFEDKVDVNTTAIQGVGLSINNLENKTDTLASMILVAHRKDEEVYKELVTIWESVAGESE